MPNEASLSRRLDLRLAQNTHSSRPMSTAAMNKLDITMPATSPLLSGVRLLGAAAPSDSELGDAPVDALERDDDEEARDWVAGEGVERELVE